MDDLIVNLINAKSINDKKDFYRLMDFGKCRRKKRGNKDYSFGSNLHNLKSPIFLYKSLRTKGVSSFSH